jgi:Uma2 family endonuclease
MQSPSTPVRLTYRDLLALPDDLLRHELIDGEHIVSPAPGTQHQRVVLRLVLALGKHLEKHPRGELFTAPFDVLLSLHDMVEPDLLYIANWRRERQLNDKRLVGPPDLAVEVLSPSTRTRDETRKLRLYERFAVSEYWLIDPKNETARLYRLVDERLALVDTLSHDATARARDLATPLLPGLAIPLASLFEQRPSKGRSRDHR